MKYTLFIVLTLFTHTLLVAQVPPGGKIKQRLASQNDRIDQGAMTGALTRKEAHRLRSQHRGIHQEVRAERLVNGGSLTPIERRQANRDLNQSSRHIKRLKNNTRLRG